MPLHQQANEIRDIVRENLRQLGVEEAELGGMNESLLVQDGRYFGRTYQAGTYLAMWMIDVKLIQFYDARGEMLRTVDLPTDTPSSHRKAA